MSISANAASRPGRDRMALLLSPPLLLAALLLAGVAPFAALAAAPASYVYFVGPPLDIDAPHNGQVVVHIDVLGNVPPDITRIRVSEVATGVTVWDVTPTTARGECW